MVENGIFVNVDGKLPNLEEAVQIEEAQKHDEALNGLIGQIKPAEYDGFLGFGSKNEPAPVVGDGREEVDYNGKTERDFASSQEYIQYLNSLQEGTIPPHSGYSKEQYVRVFARNKTTNDT